MVLVLEEGPEPGPYIEFEGCFGILKCGVAVAQEQSSRGIGGSILGPLGCKGKTLNPINNLLIILIPIS